MCDIAFIPSLYTQSDFMRLTPPVDRPIYTGITTRHTDLVQRRINGVHTTLSQRLGRDEN